MFLLQPTRASHFHTAALPRRCQEMGTLSWSATVILLLVYYSAVPGVLTLAVAAPAHCQKVCVQYQRWQAGLCGTTHSFNLGHTSEKTRCPFCSLCFDSCELKGRWKLEMLIPWTVPGWAGSNLPESRLRWDSGNVLWVKLPSFKPNYAASLVRVLQE